MEDVMNTKKLFSFLAGVLVCLSCNAFAATVLTGPIYDFYKQYFVPADPPSNQNFDTMGFRTAQSSHLVYNGFGGADWFLKQVPKVSGTPKVTFIGGKVNEYGSIPYVVMVYNSPLNYTDDDLVVSGPEPSSFETMIFTPSSAVANPYRLDIAGWLNYKIGYLTGTSFDTLWGWDNVDQRVKDATDFSFYDVTQDIMNMGGNQDGYRHIAVSLMSHAGTTEANFFDVFFDLAIPPVPEPHVYVLIGSMLALAYVLGRKKAKEQC